MRCCGVPQIRRLDGGARAATAVIDGAPRGVAAHAEGCCAMSRGMGPVQTRTPPAARAGCCATGTWPVSDHCHAAPNIASARSIRACITIGGAGCMPPELIHLRERGRPAAASHHARKRKPPPNRKSGGGGWCLMPMPEWHRRSRKGDQYICCPPLMLIVDPVTNPPSSEHRKLTPRAISLAWPNRPTGILATIFSRTGGGTAATMSVSI